MSEELELDDRFAKSSARSDIQTTISEGEQVFSLEREEHRLKAEDAATDRRIKEQKTAHLLDEERKNNDLQRLAFKVVLFTLLAVLVAAFYLAIDSGNGTTRAWAQGLISTIMGAIGGGVLGYFTGRSSK